MSVQRPNFGGGNSRSSTRSAQGRGKEPVILIGLMGVTGSGKSNFIQRLTGDKKVTVGAGLNSCTKEVGSTTFKMNGRTVELVDTPGFSDTKLRDADVLKLIADWMKRSFDEGTKLHGIVYLQRISDVRFDAGAVTSLMLFEKICGEDFLKNTAMVTTRWDKARDDDDWDQFESNENEFKGSDEMWKTPLEQGATYYRSDNQKETFENIISEIVKKTLNMPKLQRQLGEEKLDLSATAAAEGLGERLAEQRAVYMKELEETKQMYETLLREGEDNLARAMEKQITRKEVQLEENKQDQQTIGFWGRLYNGVADMCQAPWGAAAECFEATGASALAGVARGVERFVGGVFDVGRVGSRNLSNKGLYS